MKFTVSYSIDSLFTTRHERENSLSFLAFECDARHAFQKSTHAYDDASSMRYYHSQRKFIVLLLS